jgi:hypothetical protein
MPTERCEECGFDSDRWTDEGVIDALGQLGADWWSATDGLDPDDVDLRPIVGMWSIGEYTDHVREVLFAMRFVLDSAVAQPGIDLGEPPEPAFEPTPRHVSLAEALKGLAREAAALRDRLAELAPPGWTSTATIGGNEVDASWIGRHAIHDASHHLMDIDGLRRALPR